MISVNELVAILSDYHILIYVVMFFGSLIETLFPFSLFIPGEVFFYSGTILAIYGAINIFILYIVLVIGGIIGDSCSYFLGRKVGRKMFSEKRKFLSIKNLEKGEKLFNKYGNGKAIFAARFLGPASWVTPFIAGMHKMDYKRFLKYNIPAVIISILQVLIIAYLITIFGKEVILNNLKDLGHNRYIIGILILIILYLVYRLSLIILDKFELKEWLKFKKK